MWAELSNVNQLNYCSQVGDSLICLLYPSFDFTCWKSREVNWEQLAEGLEEKFESELGKMSKKRVWIGKEKTCIPRKIICVPHLSKDWGRDRLDVTLWKSQTGWWETPGRRSVNSWISTQGRTQNSYLWLLEMAEKLTFSSSCSTSRRWFLTAALSLA